MTTGQFPGTPGFDSPGDHDSPGTRTSETPDPGVKEKAQHVAGTAGEQGKQVADTAKAEASQVAAEAKNQFMSLFSDATSQVDDQSRAQKDRLAETLRTFGDDLGSMAEQGGGLAADLAQEVAQRARALSTRLQDKDPQDLLDDVRGYARRKPGTFLLGALAAGVVAGRVARSAKAAKAAKDGSDSGPGQVPGYASSPAPAVGGEVPAYSSGTLAGTPGGVPGTAPAADAPTYGSPGVSTPSGLEEGLGGAPTPPPGTASDGDFGGPGARP